MQRLYRWVPQRHVLVVSFLLIVLASVVFAHFDASRPAGTPSAVSLELAFSATTFGQIVDAWGAEGVRSYRDSIVYVDYWFSLAYALFLSGLLSTVRPSPGESHSKADMAFFGLPMCAAALDWIENTLHLVLLRRDGGFQPVLVFAASCAAVLKWSLLALVAATIVGNFYDAVVQRLKEGW